MNSSVIHRFPKFELSYETVSHKKVFATTASVALAISMGKKYFVWFTYPNTCYLLELNKDKRIVSTSTIEIGIPQKYEFGTILYGTYSSDSSPFIAEDIYYYQGNPLANLCFGDRMGFLRDFMMAFEHTKKFVMPVMWLVNKGEELGYTIPKSAVPLSAYTPHHIQYREVTRISPYINIPIPRKGIVEQAKPVVSTTPIVQIPKFDYSKPQFRMPTVFHITADIEFDVYHVYAYGHNGLPAYCGLLGMPTYKLSVFMNALFRNIRENRNLDYIEESDDEDDFQNTDETKYVDLDKVESMECVFHQKYKKWIPVRLAPKNTNIVHISKLVFDQRRPQDTPHSKIQRR